MANMETKFLKSWSEETNFGSTFSDFVKQVKEEENFNYIIIVNGLNAAADYDTRNCLMWTALGTIDDPRLLLNTSNLSVTFQTANVAIMSCHYLQYNNEFWFNKDFQLAAHIILAENRQEISNICHSLMKTEIRKAVILLTDFSLTLVYYSCELAIGKKYGQFEAVVEHVFDKKNRVYQQFYMNTYGSEIITHPDQMIERSFIYRNKMGHIKMDGYLGNIVEAFASRIKASLVFKYPVEAGKVTFAEVVENLTLQGNLDVDTSIRLVREDMGNLSYPLEFSDYCYMIPLPRHVATNKLFFIIVDLHCLVIIILMMYIYAVLITLARYDSKEYLTFIHVFLNDKSMRGLLGQPFSIPSRPRFLLKYICLLIGCSSMLFNTAYQAFLQSYLTEPPAEQLVRSYEDLRQAGIHIKATARIMYYLNPLILERYRDVFLLYDNYDEFLRERDKMDTNFAYSLTRPLWNVYQEKQKIFKQPLYFYSSSMCVMHSSLVAMPVRPGWPSRKHFDLHIMQLRDNGLMHLWTRNTFFTMLRFGKQNIADLSPDHRLKKEISLNDLFWIWVLYLTCVAVSIVSCIYWGAACCQII